MAVRGFGLAWCAGCGASTDPDLPSEAPAHAHLVTAAQCPGIAAQETYRSPDAGSATTWRPCPGRPDTGRASGCRP